MWLLKGTMTVLVSLTPFLLPLLLLPSTTQGKPNIVVIMADDLGWADVGFRDPEMATPTIDQLASDGVLLTNSYMMKSCTPSRSTFLTGTYAFRMGLQHNVLVAGANNTVPLDRRFFVQDLQEAGYKTHAVGKWHLGFCRKEMTPTYRGFDTFYGMYNGKADFYTHISKNDGYDLQDNVGEKLSVDWSGNGTYSTDLFTDRAVEIIYNHSNTEPLFLFLSYQAVHGPLQVPDRYVTQNCINVTVGGEERKLKCAMTAAMDEGIAKVLNALNATGLNEDLILFFTSDNGGPVKLGSSNWPLRGSKITEWEGGTRVVSILHSKKRLPNAPYKWGGMIHAVDWYPTLLRAAGITVNTTHMDGLDVWFNIKNNGRSKRTEFVYNINDVIDNYSLRYHNFKLVSFKRANPDGWYNPPAGQGVEEDPTGKHPDYMLFDLEQDPAERTDLIAGGVLWKYECVVELMKLKLDQYKKGLAPSIERKHLPGGDPSNFNGTWSTNWC